MLESGIPPKRSAGYKATYLSHIYKEFSIFQSDTSNLYGCVLYVFRWTKSFTIIITYCTNGNVFKHTPIFNTQYLLEIVQKHNFGVVKWSITIIENMLIMTTACQKWRTGFTKSNNVPAAKKCILVMERGSSARRLPRWLASYIIIWCSVCCLARLRLNNIQWQTSQTAYRTYWPSLRRWMWTSLHGSLEFIRHSSVQCPDTERVRGSCHDSLARTMIHGACERIILYPVLP
jgi:hypothetical protein